ncbi:MAG: response regulator [Methanobacteriota archaeon]|nr:MAG: response regulator [Euryarchaeota archaeon]
MRERALKSTQATERPCSENWEPSFFYAIIRSARCSPSPSARVAPVKVLVAEDDPTLREEVVELLRTSGHDVQAVSDGDEAVRLLEADKFDLALVDWNMPGRSGGEVLRRAREVRPQTAVIVMTGYGNVDTAVEALRSGAKDFLQKPFDIESLENTVRSIREELASRRKAETTGTPARKGRSSRGRTAEATDMMAAFLHAKQGLLVASKVRAGEKTGDEDLLVATLNIIQNFMRISFPMLKGKRLRSISQGDLTLVTETGKHVFLTVVIRGEDTRGLRERMRASLKDFEETNKAVMAVWDGLLEPPKGAEETLSRLLKPSR